MTSVRWTSKLLVTLLVLYSGGPARAQDVNGRRSSVTVARPDSATAIMPPADYVIGPQDQLSIIFFLNKDMSADVVVRPDGKISLPLLQDIQASGLTPVQLRERVSIEAKRFMQEPNPTVVVREINSRKVSILGWVERPGTYSLMGPTTVLQLIAAASGLKEYAKSSRIVVMRNDGGRQTTFKFNYKQVTAQKHVEQNIELKPGDVIIVP
jgi:polysaccharide biosynthesis/export protein